MQTIDLDEAGQHLDELTEKAAHGEEIIIRRPDGREFRLLPLPPSTGKRPGYGAARGLIEIGEDFDKPLDDFADYMP